MSSRRASRWASVVLTASVAGGLVLGVPDTASAAKRNPGVCHGVRACHVVAHVDVNGDGAPDTVGIAKRQRNLAQRGTVIVRVKVAPRRILQVKRPLRYWSGSAWQGAASIDGRPGDELVVGHIAGAHTQFLKVLTWRGSHLVNERTPDGSPDWTIDGAYNVDIGWLHRADQPLGTITKLLNERNDDTSTFTGTTSTWAWTDGRWNLTSRHTDTAIPERTAYTWGGFQIPGLSRF
jgi:hypothetical protein